MVKLGTNLPEHLILGDPGAFKEFLQGLEQLGYGYVTMGDHVLGADQSVRPDWRPYFGQKTLYDHRMAWHEPLVMFGWMGAMTKTLELCTGILISPQRQTPLLAKQAAQAALLTGDRIRFVVSVGWNDVEYEGMMVDFHKRGKIMDEQIPVLRMLWTQEVVDFKGEFHYLPHVGINPLPNKPIPLWMGGQSQPVLRRVGKMGDGWFPWYPWFNEEKMYTDLATIHEHAKAAGRSPADIGIEGAMYFDDPRFPMVKGDKFSPKTLEESVEHAKWWKKFGANRFWVTAPWANLGSEETGVREPGKKWSGVEERLKAMEEFKKAVGPDF